MKLLTNVTSRIAINGKELLAYAWSVQVGAFGSIGTVTISTTRDLLQVSEANLTEAAESANVVPLDVYVTLDDGDEEHIFGGGYDISRWDFDRDEIQIEGRDAAAPLVDAKEVFTGDGFRNQRPTGLARTIAARYGLGFQGSGGANEPYIGTIYDEEAVFSVTPQTPWSVLLFLARTVGYEVRVTPDAQLVFGPPQPQNSLILTYMATPDQEDVIPVRNLRMTHSPRRNKSFSVIVQSFHPQMTRVVRSEAQVADRRVVTGRTQNIPAGTYWASAAKAVKNQFSAGLQGTPVYTFHIDGLTPEQANAKARAIAEDIAKRQLVVTGVIDGRPNLQPQDQIVIREGKYGALNDFAGVTMFVNSVRHAFTIPSMSGGEGFITEFTALAIPPAAVDDPSVPLQNLF